MRSLQSLFSAQEWPFLTIFGDESFFLKRNYITSRWLPMSDSHSVCFYTFPITLLSWDKYDFNSKHQSQAINQYIYKVEQFSCVYTRITEHFYVHCWISIHKLSKHRYWWKTHCLNQTISSQTAHFTICFHLFEDWKIQERVCSAFIAAWLIGKISPCLLCAFSKEKGEYTLSKTTPKWLALYLCVKINTEAKTTESIQEKER